MKRRSKGRWRLGLLCGSGGWRQVEIFPRVTLTSSKPAEVELYLGWLRWWASINVWRAAPRGRRKA